MNKTILPEEQELNRLEAEQVQLEDRLVDSELGLETIKVETAKFQHRYYQTVGLLYVELDELEALIARVEADQDSENKVAQEKAGTAEEQAKKSAEEVGVKEKQPPPPPTITPELKQAYRQAAKLMHPDRATSEPEQKRRTKIMAEVNVAYSKGDKATIDKLIKEFGEDPEAIHGDDIGARVIKVIRRIAQLRHRLEEVDQELASLKEAEMYELLITVTEAEAMGGNPLDDLSTEIRKKISERKIYLEIVRDKMAR
jgi:hypothetical protein